MDIAICIFRHFLLRFICLNVFLTVFELSWFEMNDSALVKSSLRNCALRLKLRVVFSKEATVWWSCSTDGLFWLNSFMIKFKFSSKETSSSGNKSGEIEAGKPNLRHSFQWLFHCLDSPWFIFLKSKMIFLIRFVNVIVRFCITSNNNILC